MSDPVDPGTVLFDGTVTLETYEDALWGEFEIDVDTLVDGAAVLLTIGGASYDGTVKANKTPFGTQYSISFDDPQISLEQDDGNIFGLNISEDYARVGSNTLKIVQLDSGEDGGGAV